jgi:hypothetical protein
MVKPLVVARIMSSPQYARATLYCARFEPPLPWMKTTPVFAKSELLANRATARESRTVRFMLPVFLLYGGADSSTRMPYVFSMTYVFRGSRIEPFVL